MLVLIMDESLCIFLWHHLDMWHPIQFAQITGDDRTLTTDSCLSGPTYLPRKSKCCNCDIVVYGTQPVYDGMISANYQDNRAKMGAQGGLLKHYLYLHLLWRRILLLCNLSLITQIFTYSPHIVLSYQPFCYCVLPYNRHLWESIQMQSF